MKKLNGIFIFICAVQAVIAQPNLYDSIIVRDKICTPLGTSAGNIIYTKNKQTFGLYGRAVPRVGSSSFEYNPTLVKLNNNFDSVWSVMYGGTEEDWIAKVHEMPDGNLCLVGHTSSIDGTVTYNPTPLRMIWVQIVDTNGVVLKAKVFGALNGGNDYRHSMVTNNGDIYICAMTLGNDHDFAHTNNGNGFNNDGVLLKLNSNLDICWTRFISSDAGDVIEGVSQFSDTKILVSAATSDNLEPANLPDSARGEADAIVKMLDTAGNTIWARRYGSVGNDAMYNCVYNKTENRIYAVGMASSFSGDITYKCVKDDTITTVFPPVYYYFYNEWILVLDTNGNKLHSKCYGDSIRGYGMYYRDLFIYNNQVYTLFNSGDGGGNLPINIAPFRSNAFIGKFDSNANLIAKYVINGNGEDELGINLIKEGNLFVAGASINVPGNSNNTYSCDTSKSFRFFLRLTDVPLSLAEVASPKPTNQLIIIPNPSHDKITIVSNGVYGKYALAVYDGNGKEWLQFSNLQGAEQIINITNLPPQAYFVKIAISNGSAIQGSFIKQ